MTRFDDGFWNSAPFLSVSVSLQTSDESSIQRLLDSLGASPLLVEAGGQLCAASGQLPGSRASGRRYATVSGVATEVHRGFREDRCDVAFIVNARERKRLGVELLPLPVEHSVTDAAVIAFFECVLRKGHEVHRACGIRSVFVQDERWVGPAHMGAFRGIVVPRYVANALKLSGDAVDAAKGDFVSVALGTTGPGLSTGSSA